MSARCGKVMFVSAAWLLYWVGLNMGLERTVRGDRSRKTQSLRRIQCTRDITTLSSSVSITWLTRGGSHRFLLGEQESFIQKSFFPISPSPALSLSLCKICLILVNGPLLDLRRFAKSEVTRTDDVYKVNERCSSTYCRMNT